MLPGKLSKKNPLLPSAVSLVSSCSFITAISYFNSSISLFLVYNSFLNLKINLFPLSVIDLHLGCQTLPARKLYRELSSE